MRVLGTFRYKPYARYVNTYAYNSRSSPFVGRFLLNWFGAGICAYGHAHADRQALAILTPMGDLPTAWTVIAALLRILLLVVFYMIIGFGPGFMLGVLLANRVFAKGNPLRMEKHQQVIQQAVEHNKQWNPNDPRWKQ